MISTLSPSAILFPQFAMFLLAAVVLLRMRTLRFGAVREGQVSVEYFRAYDGEVGPRPLRVIERHFANLFEVPMLLHVGCLMAYVTRFVDGWAVGFAWLYVVLRVLHTIVHLTRNDVVVRFGLYMASNLVLTAFWLLLLVRLLRYG
jgi:hypothetical protein